MRAVLACERRGCRTGCDVGEVEAPARAGPQRTLADLDAVVAGCELPPPKKVCMTSAPSDTPASRVTEQSRQSQTPTATQEELEQLRREVKSYQEKLCDKPMKALEKAVGYLGFKLICAQRLEIVPITSLRAELLTLPTEWKTPPPTGYVMIVRAFTRPNTRCQVHSPQMVRQIIRTANATQW